MFLTNFPFKYYAVLPDSTLTTKIRQQSWKLDKLFPMLKNSKSEIKRLSKSIKSNTSNILKLKHPIALLAAEIRTGIKDLKLINFYDSTILYLYYKLLKHVLDLCKKEQNRLMQKIKDAISKEAKLKEQKLENIKKTKKEIEKKIKEYERLIKGFDKAKKELIKAYEKLIGELKRRRWGAEKQAQHEFALLRLTLRGIKNLNRKIKVEAIKVKKEVVPQKILLMRRIQQQVKHEDVVELANLVSNAIDRISKDVLYSSKLISKFENEVNKLKSIVENLKKIINKSVKDNKIKEETAKKITQPWDDAIKYVEEQIHRDLMQIFRNIFVEYKYVATRQL